MPWVVAVVGILIVGAGLLGVVAPLRLMAVMTLVRGTGGLLFAAGMRLVVGILFVLAAPECRWPLLVWIVGIIAIAAAVGLVVMGPKRLEKLVGWFAGRPAGFTRTWALGAIVFGVLLAYASGRLA